ncbi:MAG: ester cyclase [Acidimicrobiia bacterium]
MTATETSLRQVREATVRRHYEAENRHDLDALLSTFSGAKTSYDIPAFGEAGQLRGAAAVREMWEGLLVAFPDIHHEVIRLRHGDDFVLVEYEVTGTQQADWAGIPASGRPFSIRVAAVYEFEGDQLVCERVYTDVADWARQLGSGPGRSADSPGAP